MSEVNTTREAYDISTRRDNSQYTFLLLCIQEELKLNKKSFVFSPFRSRQWKTVSVSLLTCLRIEWKSFLPRAVSLLCIIKLSENKICVIFFLHWEKLLAIEIFFFCDSIIKLKCANNKTLHHRTSRSQSTNSYHRSNSSIAEDSQLTTFAPYIQAFLTQTTRRYSCCNVMLPLAFERAAGNSFVNPKFDSQVLEEQYQISILPQIRLRFRWVTLHAYANKQLDVRYMLFSSIIIISIRSQVGPQDAFISYFDFISITRNVADKYLSSSDDD